MRKISILLAVLLLCLCGCSKSEKGNYNIVEQNKNYEVYAYSKGDDPLSDFVYIVFNRNGEKIDSKYLELGEPRFKELEDSILKVGYGTGTNSEIVTYYDLANSLISKEYQNVCYDDGEKVAYITYGDGDTFICVSDTFGNEPILKEVLNMGGIMTTEFKVDIKDGKITVEHAQGKDYKTIVESFDLKI